MGELNALQLAQLVNLQVQYDLPIGPGNTLSNATRTGGWNGDTLRAIRSRLTPYRLVVENGEKVWRRQRIHHRPDRNDEYNFLDQISKTLHYKGGNCGEMSRLAMLRLAQYAATHLSEQDTFCFEWKLLKEYDHKVAIIELNGEKAICDPWANYSNEMGAENLIGFLGMLFRNTPRNENKAVLKGHMRVISECPDADIFKFEEKDPFKQIKTLSEAKRLATLHASHHAKVLRDDHTYLRFLEWSYPVEKNDLHHQRKLICDEIKARKLK